MQKIHLALATSAALILAACGGSSGSGSSRPSSVPSTPTPAKQNSTQPPKQNSTPAPTPAQNTQATQLEARNNLTSSTQVNATTASATAFTDLDSLNLGKVTTSAQAKTQLEDFSNKSTSALAQADAIASKRLETSFDSPETSPQVQNLTKELNLVLDNGHGDGADALRLLHAFNLTSGSSSRSVTEATQAEEENRSAGDQLHSQSAPEPAAEDPALHNTSTQSTENNFDSLINVEPKDFPENGLRYNITRDSNLPHYLPTDLSSSNYKFVPLTKLNGAGIKVGVVGEKVGSLSSIEQAQVPTKVQPVGASVSGENFYADTVLSAARYPTGYQPGQNNFDSGLAYLAEFKGVGVFGDKPGVSLDAVKDSDIIALSLKDLRIEDQELVDALQVLDNPEKASKNTYLGSLAQALHAQDALGAKAPLIIVELPEGDFSKKETSLVQANDLAGLLASSKHRDRFLFVTSTNKHSKLLKGCGVTAQQCISLEAVNADNNSAGTIVAIAALIKQRYPWMTAKQVRDTILTTTKRTGTFNKVTGWQTPDALTAVAGPRAILGNTTWDLTQDPVTNNTTDPESDSLPPANLYAFYHPITGEGKLTVSGKNNTPVVFLDSVQPSQGLELTSGTFYLTTPKTLDDHFSRLSPELLDQQRIYKPSNFAKLVGKAVGTLYGGSGHPYFSEYFPALSSQLTGPAKEVFDNRFNTVTVKQAEVKVSQGYFEELKLESGANVSLEGRRNTLQPIAIDKLTVAPDARLHLFLQQDLEAPMRYSLGTQLAAVLTVHDEIKNDPQKLKNWVQASWYALARVMPFILPESRHPIALTKSYWESQDLNQVPDTQKLKQYLLAYKNNYAPYFNDALTEVRHAIDNPDEFDDLDKNKVDLTDDKFIYRLVSLGLEAFYLRNPRALGTAYEEGHRDKIYSTDFQGRAIDLRNLLVKAKSTSKLEQLTAGELLNLNFTIGRGLLVKHLVAGGDLYLHEYSEISPGKPLFGYLEKTGEFAHFYTDSSNLRNRYTVEQNQELGYYYLEPFHDKYLDELPVASRTVEADYQQLSLVKRGLDSLNDPAPAGYSRLYSRAQLESTDLDPVATDKSLLIDSAKVATTLLSSDLEVAQAADPSQGGSSASTATTNNVVLSDKLTKDDNPVRALAGKTKPTGVTVNTVTGGANGAAPTVTPTTFSLNDKDVYLQARKALADYSDLELGTFLYRASAAAYSASHLAVSQQTRVLNSDFLVQAGQFKQAVSAADLADAASGAAASGLKLNTYAQYAFKRADWTQEASQVVGKWNHHNFAVGVYGQLDLNQAAGTGSTAGTAGNLGAVNLGLAATHLTGTWLEALDAKFDKSVLSENQVSSTSLVATAGYAWNKAFLNLGAAYSYQGFNSQRTLFTERDLTAEYVRHEAALSALAGAQLVGDQLVGLQARAGVTATYSYQGEFAEKLNSEPKATDAAKALALTAKSASAWELVGNLGVVGTYKFVTNGLTQGLDASVDVSLRALNADYAVKGETLVNKAAKTEFTSGATFKPTYLVRAQAGYSYEFVPGLNVRVGAGYSKTTNWGAFEGDVKLTYSF